MDYQVIETAKGPVALPLWEGEQKIQTYREFFELLMEAPAPTLQVDGSRIADAFFDLRTGFAGEILQKVSNYRRRLIILGDFSAVGSRSLRDFIRESNRTGQVVFVATADQGVDLLTDH